VPAVTHDLAFDEEDHVLGDVRALVGDPLQVARRREHVDRGLDPVRVAPRHLLHRLEHPAVDPIDHGVGGEHLAGAGDVRADQRVERLAHHRAHGVDHRAEVLGHRDRIVPLQVGGALGDVAGQIPHPLQVVVHFRRGDQVAQVLRHRLVQGEDLQALLFDRDLVRVDRVVAAQHLVGQVGPAFEEGPRRLGDGALDHRPDQQEPVREVFEIAEEVPGHPGRTRITRPCAPRPLATRAECGRGTRCRVPAGSPR